MRAFSPAPEDSGVGAVSISSFFLPSISPLGTVSTHNHPASLLWAPFLGGSCRARGPWAGTTSPQFCMHVGKEGAQESMEPVLWPRLGARVQGGLGPIPVLTCTMTFRASLRPSLLCSLPPPERLGKGTRERGSSLPLLPPKALSVQVESRSFPFLRRGCKVSKRVRIQLSIAQLILKVGLRNPLRGSP